MTIRIRGLVSSNNGGDGVRIEGDVHLDAEDIHTFGNGGQGINIIRHAGLLEQLGLPKETDPVALAKLLTTLQNVPAAEKEAAVLQSGILQRIGKVAVDGSTFISNVLSIAGNPAVHTIIQQLLRGA
jgi:hypothetical protein